jgi:hypothetical protein
MPPDTESPFRPYAPPANMQALLYRLRRMNLPPRITRELLKGVGISENIAPRLLSTLRFLDITNEQDEPTDILRGLAGSTEDEYKQLLERTVRSAYAEDFNTIDPAVDPQERITNAFQRYIPRSQHDRQVTLFLGLCREAGIPTMDVPRRRSMQNRVRGRRSAARSSAERLHLSPTPAMEAGTPRSGARRETQTTTQQLLGLTLEDAAHLPEEDFREVWNALGTLFLRRAQRLLADSEE